MQKRICDCWLRVGGCFCELIITENNENTDNGTKTNNKARHNKRSNKSSK